MQGLNCLSCLDNSAFAFVSISTILDVSLNTNPAMSFTLTNLELVQDTRAGKSLGTRIWFPLVVYLPSSVYPERTHTFFF